MTCKTLEKTVIATGGGLPCHYDNLEIMLGNGAVMYLKASPSILAERLESNDTLRPLLSETSDLQIQQLESLLHERKSCYERAHHVVNTDGDEPYAVVERIIQVLMR